VAPVPKIKVQVGKINPVIPLADKNNLIMIEENHNET